MSADPARAALDARVLAWMREPRSWRRDDARFEALALDLFAFQFAHCAPYRRFCERPRAHARARRAAGARSRRCRRAPSRSWRSRSFPAEREAHVFRTSGTATERRGALHLDTLELYEASLLPSFRRGVLPDLAAGARARIRVLAPSPAEAPDSSLSHMFGVVLRELGDARERLRRARRRARTSTRSSPRSRRRRRDGVAVALCGTAFAFVHLLDALAERGARIALPRRVARDGDGRLQGPRARAAARRALRRHRAALGVAPERIVNQYGMTELGSQFYDSVLARARARRAASSRRPGRACASSIPRRGDDARPGALGVVTIVDLANTGSVLAIQTADLGRAIGDGFEVIGREPGAEARGCSIAADEMLGVVSAAAVRGALERLRDAGRLLRERSAADVHAALARRARRVERAGFAVAEGARRGAAGGERLLAPRWCARASRAGSRPTRAPRCARWCATSSAAPRGSTRRAACAPTASRPRRPCSPARSRCRPSSRSSRRSRCARPCW